MPLPPGDFFNLNGPISPLSHPKTLKYAMNFPFIEFLSHIYISIFGISLYVYLCICDVCLYVHVCLPIHGHLQALKTFFFKEESFIQYRGPWLARRAGRRIMESGWPCFLDPALRLQTQGSAFMWVLESRRHVVILLPSQPSLMQA